MKAIAQFFRVFKSRKMAALLALGFASGLPYALTDDAFRAWLTSAKFDLSTIGWLGLVSLPYSLKFLWSPLIDRFVPPFLGRRRGWILLTQASLVLAILAVALQMFAIGNVLPTERSGGLPILAIAALILAFLSASQDIAIDAYRTDVLEAQEVGAGIGIWVLGYRIALLFAGFIGFNLASQWGWAWVYVLLAVVMGLSIIATIASPEPPEVEARPTTLNDAVVKPFQEFFQRLGLTKVLLILVFTIFYRFSDAVVGKMAVPFLKTLFDDGTIGTVRQGIGLVATIVGTLAGGAILSKIGINRSLWVFGFLQAISNIGYYAISVVGNNNTKVLFFIGNHNAGIVLYAVPLKDLVFLVATNVENFCGGLGTAGFLGFLMVLCNPRFSATQFALLSSLFAVGRDLLASPFSGESAQFIQRNMSSWTAINQISWLAGSDGKGWALFFLFTLLLAMPGMMFLPFFAPWNGEFRKVDSLPID
jgi:PAT family beta-lactamase induction signal transducer AmpG